MNIHKEVNFWELIVLAVLLVFAAYYFLIHQPLSERHETIQSERSRIESEMLVSQTKLATMKKRQKELNELYEKYEDNPPVLALYNNMNSVMTDLHLTLGDSEKYNISFQNAQADGIVVRQNMNISFTTTDYDRAVQKLSDILNSSNTFMIKDMSLGMAAQQSASFSIYDKHLVSGGNQADMISVSFELTEFEYNDEK